MEKYINVPEFLIQNLNLLNDKSKKINILILKPKNVTELEMYWTKKKIYILIPKKYKWNLDQLNNKNVLIDLIPNIN